MTLALDQPVRRFRGYPFENEPPRDYSIELQREAMAAAIREARRGLPAECPVWIDGERIATEGGIESANPARVSERVARSGAATAELVDRAVGAARRAFGEWGGRPARERAAVLRRAAGWIRERRDRIAALEVIEAGKPWKEADADVCEAIDFLEYYATEAVRLSRPLALQPDIPGEVNLYGYSPVGVAGVIAPWNFPLAIPAGMTAAALVAGNTVCFKPAEQTPLVGWTLCEALFAGGCSPGALHYLPGRGEEAGAALVNHPGVDLIAFTGSREVGFGILREAAAVLAGQRSIKRVVCELGGKNAMIVDATADLDAAVPDILYSAFGYSGQKCSACSRVIALESVHDTLLRRLVDAAEGLRVGSPEIPGTDMGPLIDKAAKAKAERYIAAGRMTARAVCGGDASSRNPEYEGGWYVAPHIFADVSPDDPLATEEIFGPVLALLRARDIGEAIALANAVPFALTGGIHSRTPRSIRRAARELRVGNFYANRSISGAIVFRQPFGGFGHSGVGSKAGGPDYLKQFLLARSWSENTMRHGYAPLEGEN